MTNKLPEVGKRYKTTTKHYKSMREIKFRVWDKQNITMHNWEEISIEKDQVFISDGDLYKTMDQIELIQFTGLKDKNGKEIYEGDIVVCDRYPFYRDDELKELNYVGEIFWFEDNVGWGLDFHVVGDRVLGCACGGGLDEYIDAGMRIIGNIYENPELLK